MIGSIRRECLDQIVIFDEGHLRHVLSSYMTYYHRARTHLSLDKDTPDFPRGQKFGCIAAMPILLGRIIITYGSEFSAGTRGYCAKLLCGGETQRIPIPVICSLEMNEQWCVLRRKRED